MAPRAIHGSKAQPGFISSTYETLTSAENAAVVRSLAVFGVAIAFLSSSLAPEFLAAF